MRPGSQLKYFVLLFVPLGILIVLVAFLHHWLETDHSVWQTIHTIYIPCLVVLTFLAIGCLFVSRVMYREFIAQSKIREQNAFLNNILNAITHPFMVVDAKTRQIVLANQEARNSFDSPGPTCFSLMRKGKATCIDAGGDSCPVDVVKNNRGPVTLQHRHFDKQGDEHFTEIHAFPIFDEMGQVVQVVHHCIDVTGRLKAEAALSRSEATVRAILMAIPDMMYRLSPEGVILEYLGGRFDEVIVPPEELPGKSVFDFLPAEFAEEIAKHIRITLQTETTGIFEHEISFNGMTRFYEIRIVFMNTEEVLGIVRDITDRKAAEREILAAQNNLAIAQGIAHIGNWQWDFATNEIVWSKEVYRIFGFVPEVFKPDEDTVFALFHHEDMGRIMESIERSKVEGVPYNIEHRIIKSNGQIAYIHAQAEVTFDADGTAVLMRGTIQDITERKNADATIQALFESTVGITGQEFFDRVVEQLAQWFNCDVAIVGELIQDKSIRVISMYQDYRIKRGDIYCTDRTPCAQVMAKGKAIFTDRVQDIFPDDPDLRQLDAEGYIGVALRNADGEPIGLLNAISRKPLVLPRRSEEVMNIIAARAAAEIQRLQAEEELRKLSLAVQYSPATVVITDPKGHIEYVNPEFEKTTGYSASEALGKNPRILGSGRQSGDFYKQLWQTICSGGVWQGEFLNKRKDGSLYWEHASIAPIKDRDGKISHFVAVKEDVTERKQLLQELQESRDKLEKRVRERTAELAQANEELKKEIQVRTEVEDELALERENLEKTVLQRTEQLRESLQQLELANLHKSRFLSSMSHELRTPLNAILGFSDLLKEKFFGPLTDKQGEYVEHIRASGAHLLELINDLLDVAKIDSGAVSLEIEQVPVAECIELPVSTLKAGLDKKGLTASIQIEKGIESIFCDRRRFKQIMLNLLSNAGKYTPEGGRIDVAVSKEGDSTVRVSVSDTGIGIEPEELTKVFSEFHQVNRARDEALGGTGIGLALTRRLVELHGGEIGAESQVGQGSTFWFRIPLLAAMTSVQEHPKIPEHRLESIDLSDRKILVAEDNPVNQALIREALTAKGAEVRLARNGLEVLETIGEFTPDMILMDVRMPKMDGLEATRRIRAMQEFKNLPIIALTAAADAKIKKDALDAGCNLHVPKPINIRVLFHVIDNCLHEGKNF